KLDRDRKTEIERRKNLPRQVRKFSEYKKEHEVTFEEALYAPDKTVSVWADLPMQLQEETLPDLPPDLSPADAPGAPAADFTPPDEEDTNE
ncbi:MAG: hypothetical protein IKU17_01090, partial [Clostridia bacterium]|nr:hypothetical protein [Clostridia bacterium]